MAYLITFSEPDDSVLIKGWIYQRIILSASYIVRDSNPTFADVLTKKANSGYEDLDFSSECQQYLIEFCEALNWVPGVPFFSDKEDLTSNEWNLLLDSYNALSSLAAKYRRVAPMADLNKTST